MNTYENVHAFFKEILNDIKCQEDTKAYIVSIYGKYQTSHFDLSDNSITLLFAQARNKHDFFTYQNIGDWILFANTLFPKQANYNNKDYYDTIARLSYYSCYKLINKQWKLFEELADNFQFLETQIISKLESFKA